MDVKTCKECRRLFNYLRGPYVCPACAEKLEQKFSEVKEYVREHPGITLQALAEDCDVDIKQIKQWLREERLELIGEGNGYLSCDSCGVSINSGRLCEKCKSVLQGEMQNIVRKNIEEQAAKMKAVRAAQNSGKERFHTGDHI